jgi:hypothetical protein
MEDATYIYQRDKTLALKFWISANLQDLREKIQSAAHLEAAIHFIFLKKSFSPKILS